MAAQLYMAVRRAGQTGEAASFRLVDGSTFELATPVASANLEADVLEHNASVQAALLDFLHEMHPRQVELLIGKLLGALGFEDVQVTRYVGDFGIDIEATLTLGGVTEVRTAVQVKRYKSNIAGDLVRQIRGSLEADQRGLIITTGGFTKDAKSEAAAPGKTPISLIDGARLVELLVQQQIGVHGRAIHLLALNLDELVSGESTEAEGKVAALWPLPGGSGRYFATLLAFLDQIAESRPTIVDFIGWVTANYPKVKSANVVTSAVRTVLWGLRLIRFADDRLVIDGLGDSLRQSRLPSELKAVLEARITGIAEILRWLAVGPLRTDEILERLREEVGVTWETNIQVRYRLEWLEAAGAVVRDEGRWRLRGTDT